MVMCALNMVSRLQVRSRACTWILEICVISTISSAMKENIVKESERFGYFFNNNGFNHNLADLVSLQYSVNSRFILIAKLTTFKAQSGISLITNVKVKFTNIILYFNLIYPCFWIPLSLTSQFNIPIRFLIVNLFLVPINSRLKLIDIGV